VNGDEWKMEKVFGSEIGYSNEGFIKLFVHLPTGRQVHECLIIYFK
jgi:hypothetical protein